MKPGTARPDLSFCAVGAWMRSHCLLGAHVHDREQRFRPFGLALDMLTYYTQ
jgi:hypothetical protein